MVLYPITLIIFKHKVSITNHDENLRMLKFMDMDNMVRCGIVKRNDGMVVSHIFIEKFYLNMRKKEDLDYVKKNRYFSHSGRYMNTKIVYPLKVLFKDLTCSYCYTEEGKYSYHGSNEKLDLNLTDLL